MAVTGTSFFFPNDAIFSVPGSPAEPPPDVSPRGGSGTISDPDRSGPSADRASRLSAAILRISQSLDVARVLREAIAGARSLTGANSGAIAMVCERGLIRSFITSGVSREERREIIEWPDGPRLLRAPAGPSGAASGGGPFRLPEIARLFRGPLGLQVAAGNSDAPRAWLDARVCPDHQLIIIARDDDTTFGILHSRFHEVWSLRMGTWLGKGNDPRYTPTTTFETFPLPEGLSPDVPASDCLTDPRAHYGSTGHIAARVFPEHYRQGISLCRVHVHPVLLFHRDDAGCVPAAIVLGPPLGCILVGFLIPVHGRCRNGQVQNVAAELSVAGSGKTGFVCFG